MSSGSLINIPERLKEKLHADSQWESKVTNVIANIHDLLITTPTFFPEYTNHGIIHINHILEISDKLISDKTLQKLTSKTLGIYIISAMLHDIGMFINYDTFKKLIDDDTYTKVSPLDDQSLKECWNVYLSELKRFSSKTLVRKFGTTDINFKKLPSHKEMTSLDILVIGEFIRQHHHKISQYIILHNLMDDDLLNNTGIRSDDPYRLLIGVLTRSHGMNVRDTEDYLEKHFSSADKASGVEIYYLMCVLRLADYLDAGEERASHIIESMFVKYSEISQKEYSWNQCIRYEDFNWDVEKESLTIDAMPDNPEQFINVTKLLNAIQSELDMCWAIIGEHYNLKEYRFSIRRICSNLLKKTSVEEYEKKFYTKAVSLNANPDILNLLIEPLYGNNPSFGVRELLQNATDACKERKVINSGKKKYDGKVIVSLDTEKNLLTITDNGIGMNIDTIVNYYLSAGASYRNSEEWVKRYSDSRGKSKVKRNGRFGIGVLATFLLGDVATITTRHIDDDLGWTFNIHLNQDNIEIKRTNADFGTTVSIALSSMTINKLMNNHSSNCPSWDQWYNDDFPMVLYYLNGNVINNAIPDIVSWHTIKQKDYKNYCWAYSLERKKYAFCNGVIIPEATPFSHEGKYRFNISTPILKIEDTEGRLPINLSRSQLIEIPYQQELYLGCCKYFLAKLLTATLDHSTKKENSYVGVKFYADKCYDYTNFIFSSNGYLLKDAAFMKHARIQYLNILCTDFDNLQAANTVIKNVPFIYRKYHVIVENLDMGYFNLLFDEFLHNEVIYKTNYIFASSEANAYLQNYINTCGCFYNGEGFVDFLEKSNECNEYTIWGSITQREIKASDLANLMYPMIIGLGLKKYNLHSAEIMLNVLREYIPCNTFIPYDLDERKKLFPKAFNELKEYMDD